MKSLFAGVYGVYLLVTFVMIVVGPLVLLRERRRRRGDGPGPGRGA